MNLRHQLPPYVYVPGELGESEEDFEPETLLVPAGRALLVYTALDRLWRARGAERTWAVLTLPAITELRARVGFEALLVDEGLPEHERWNIAPAEDE